jgi:hypothetical protein
MLFVAVIIHLLLQVLNFIKFLEESKIYAFGSNSDGQLGLGDNKDRRIPFENSKLEKLDIIKIACGSCHTLALSSNIINNIRIWKNLFIWKQYKLSIRIPT